MESNYFPYSLLNMKLTKLPVQRGRECGIIKLSMRLFSLRVYIGTCRTSPKTRLCRATGRIAAASCKRCLSYAAAGRTAWRAACAASSSTISARRSSSRRSSTSEPCSRTRPSARPWYSSCRRGSIRPAPSCSSPSTSTWPTASWRCRSDRDKRRSLPGAPAYTCSRALPSRWSFTRRQ